MDDFSKERIEIRCKEETKKIIQQAAKICGNTVSGYILALMTSESLRIIDQHYSIMEILKDE